MGRRKIDFGNYSEERDDDRSGNRYISLNGGSYNEHIEGNVYEFGSPSNDYFEEEEDAWNSTVDDWSSTVDVDAEDIE